MTKQLHRGLFPKAKFTITKQTLLIYSYLLESSQIHIVNTFHKWGNLELKENHAHVILGPTKHNQGVV